MMHSTLAEAQFTHNDSHKNTLTLDQARSWIGCRLVLRKPYLGFTPGLTCIVSCVVDFGEGCLLWVSSYDDPSVDVDQLNLNKILEYFQLSPAAVQLSAVER